MIIKPVVLLSIGFDAEQISDQLAYQFFSTDGPQPKHPTGLFGGDIHFDKNSLFRLQVTGSGTPERFHDFKIIDCTLVTKPLIVKADSSEFRYAPPSPFRNCSSACQKLPLDFAPGPANLAEAEGRALIITKDWQHELNVGDVDGRWDLSLIVTVAIMRSACSAPELRVFSFDPEGQVGAGGGHDY